MKALPILMLLVLWCGRSLSADEPLPQQHGQVSTVTMQELLDGLPQDDRRAQQARLGIEYCLGFRHTNERTSVRLPVKTKKGLDADIVFLHSPHFCIPCVYFSMALLMVDDQVVDSVSCWSHTRTSIQELMLEDVDGDGLIDVAFRGQEGFWGKPGNRLQGLADDPRLWFYAYTITDKGFQSIFPQKEQVLKAKLVCDTADQPVKLEVLGLPKSFNVYEMVECKISVTNTSTHNLMIDPDELVQLKIDGAGVIVTRASNDKRKSLKPNETITKEIYFCITQEVNEAEFKCTYQHPQTTQ